MLLSFMNFVKNNEPEIIRTFNDWCQINEDFYKYIKLKNKTIENYKRPRGFPLELDPNWILLYSIDSDIKHEQLLKMKLDNEKDLYKLQPKRKKLSFSDDSFFDSWDDGDSVDHMDNLRPIKKKALFQPISDGKFYHKNCCNFDLILINFNLIIVNLN